jgi:HEAT repeat protein
MRLTLVLSIICTIVPAAQSFPTLDAFRAAPVAQKITALQTISSGRMTLPADVLDQYVTIAIADVDARVRELGLAAIGWLEARRAVMPGLSEKPTPALVHHERSIRRLVTADSNPRVRIAALAALSYLTMTKPLQLSDDVIALVGERVRNERDGLARISALGLLLNTQSAAVTDILVTALSDIIPAVRAKAIEVLGHQQVTSTIARIVGVLTKDVDWFPRWHAARALGRMWPYSRSVLATVEARAKTDPDTRVREEIAQALISLRRPFPSANAPIADAAFPDIYSRPTKLFERPLLVADIRRGGLQPARGQSIKSLST